MLWFYESFFPVVWIAFVLYWRIKAADTKTDQRLEPAASQILRVQNRQIRGRGRSHDSTYELLDLPKLYPTCFAVHR
jgi:hypothetical protein